MARNAQVIIIPWTHFETELLGIRSLGVTSGAKPGPGVTARGVLEYHQTEGPGKKLVVQTPIFERCFFGDAKYATESRINVAFTTDNTDFCERVGTPIEESVQARVAAGADAVLGVKSAKGLLFNSHVKPNKNPDRYKPYYNVTIKCQKPKGAEETSSVPECKFYSKDGECIEYAEFERSVKEGASVRALLEYGSIYMAGRSYGVTCYARQIQCLDPIKRDIGVSNNTGFDYSDFAFVEV